MSGSTVAQSDWRRLFRIACHLIDQVNDESCIIRRWTLGGGTAIMLQIDHRESHDIDIFFDDPQWLGFLNPSIRDFTFELMPNEYGGDGHHSYKFAFTDIGEIDFIIASELTDEPALNKTIEGRPILLETVPEIIAKKNLPPGLNY